MIDEIKVDKSKAKAQPERMTVTLEGLKAEFGDVEGEAKYLAIARLEGEVVIQGVKTVCRYFFDPVTEGVGYRPELILATLPEEARKRAADIINAK